MTIEYFDYIKIVCIGAFILIVFIVLIGFRTTLIKRQLTDLRIRLLVNQREQTLRHQLLLSQIKRQSDKPSALEQLQQIFGDKMDALRHQYPALTDIDMQVLLLIGFGVENHEILTFTGMSKRTYYKRRQLIAQRMNTTAAQLNTIAKQLFSPNTSTL